MTGRGRSLLALGMIGLCLGIYMSRSTLAWLSLTVLLWLFVQWLWFHWRLVTELPRLQITRTVGGRRDSSGFLFAGRTVMVEVQVTQSGWQTGNGPLLIVRDCLPENLTVVQGNCEHTSVMRMSEFRFAYKAKVCGSGLAKLSGFRITLQDPQSFFVTQRFVPVVQRFRVLPAFANITEARPIVKRVNSLPQHGVHRVQRAGMGSELLELREYVPGDPPKSIAWKVSARRNTLMTRQYESEVPVRVVLFLDGSISARTGGFGCRLLDQMLFVAGSVARSAISVGDPVGAVLFDERGIRRIAPSGGERGFYRMLEALSDFSVNPPAPQQRLSRGLMNAVLRLCGERYPELLDPKVNQVPFTFLPIAPWKRRKQHRRTQIAAILAETYQMSPTQLVELVHNDSLMATWCQRMLSDGGVSWMDPLVQTTSQGLHDGMATMELLGKALTQSVATAKDNEVYVIMANLLECATDISHLLPAFKVAMARHHRVVVISPTPSFRRPQKQAELSADPTPEELLARADELQTLELGSRLQRELRRIGVRVSLSGEDSAIRMVLAETQMARDGRISLSGVR